MLPIIKIDKKTLAARARGRSHIYGLLSQIYIEEPSQGLLEKFQDSTFLQLLKQFGSDLEEELKIGPLDELVEELAIEYTRLFIGPGKHIYPYESAYRRKDTDISQTTSRQIEIFVKSHGLQYNPDFCQAPDHIGVEMAFMERATDAEAEAWGKDDGRNVMEILKVEKQFVDEHLVKWIPGFSDKVVKEGSLSFYREIAKLTKEYILLESREIKDLIRQIKALNRGGGFRDV